MATVLDSTPVNSHFPGAVNEAGTISGGSSSGHGTEAADVVL